jgi:hypothetical protein
VVLKVVNKFGDLEAGDEFHLPLPSGGMRYTPAVLELAGGEVVAVDGEGRPALVAHTFSKGKTLLCAYPLEAILARIPAAFERPNDLHRLYRALRQWAGIVPLFETGQPSVEISALLDSGPQPRLCHPHQPQRRGARGDSHYQPAHHQSGPHHARWGAAPRYIGRTL